MASQTASMAAFLEKLRLLAKVDHAADKGDQAERLQDKTLSDDYNAVQAELDRVVVGDLDSDTFLTGGRIFSAEIASMDTLTVGSTMPLKFPLGAIDVSCTGTGSQGSQVFAILKRGEIEIARSDVWSAGELPRESEALNSKLMKNKDVIFMSRSGDELCIAYSVSKGDSLQISDLAGRVGRRACLWRLGF